MSLQNKNLFQDIEFIALSSFTLLAILLPSIIVSILSFFGETELQGFLDIFEKFYIPILAYLVISIFLLRPHFSKPNQDISQLNDQTQYKNIFTFILNYCCKRKNTKICYILYRIDYIFSLICIGLVALSIIYLYNIFGLRGFYPNLDFISYIVLTIILLEATRRIEGIILPVIIAISLFLYIVVNPEELNTIFSQQALFSKGGIFGEAFHVAITIVYLFVIFSFTFRLIHIDKFIDWFAFKLTHERRSGPSSALYAIVASTLYGAISGAGEDNVRETGRKTINVMRQAGYPLSFAASIEATASSIGQIMPPVMGVVAFIIIDISAEKYSYLDVMLVALIPAFLFALSLIIAVILEARLENLKPIDLAFAHERLQTITIDEKTKNAQRNAIIFSFGVFFGLLIMGLPLVVCITAAIGGLWLLAFTIPSLKPSTEEIIENIRESAKSGVTIAVSCASIGILVYLYEHTVIGDVINLFFNDWLTWSVGNSFLYLSLQFIVLCLFALIPLILGMGLPTPAIFLITIFIAKPILEQFNINDLHIYLFVLYYAVLSGIIPPVAPVLKEASKLLPDDYKEDRNSKEQYFYQVILSRILNIIEFFAYNVDKKQKLLYLPTFQLSIIALLLPITWIYHPEIMLDTWNFSHLVNEVFVLFSFIIAILGISVAIYGVFRRDKGKLNLLSRRALAFSAFLIALPNTDSLMILFSIIGVLSIIGILIFDDLMSDKNSALRPSFTLIKLVLHPKNLSFSTVIVFISLVVVFSGFFVTTALSLNIQAKLSDDWLTDRYHFMVEVKSCDGDEQQRITDELNKMDYSSSLYCTPYGNNISVSKGWSSDKVAPSEIGITTGVYAVEYDAKLLEILKLEDKLQTSFEQTIQADYCLEELNSLQNNHFNLNQVLSTECSVLYGSGQSLPIIYMAKGISEQLGIDSGAVVYLHHSIYGNAIQELLSTDTQPQFVVAVIYDSGFPDINKSIIIPNGALQTIPDLYPEHQIFVKIDSLHNLQQVKEITDTLKELKVFDDINTQAIDIYLRKITEFLKGINAISIVSGFMCLLILLAGCSQLIESNIRIVVLLRLLGLRESVGITFVLLLVLIGTFVPFVISILVSFIINYLLSIIYINISPVIHLELFRYITATMLLIVIIATFILRHIHLSHDIPKELELCQP